MAECRSSSPETEAPPFASGGSRPEDLMPRSPFFLLAFVGACSGTPEPSGPVRARDANGIEWVRNTSSIGWPDTSGWRIAEVAVITPADTGPGALTNPTAALLGGDGLLYVAEREPRSVKVFDRAGGYLRTLGRAGEGPGEFRYVMLGLVADTVVVQDPILTRLSRFRPDGTLIDVHPSSCCMMGPILPTHVDGRLSVPMVGGWLRGFPGALTDTIVWPPDPEFDTPVTWTFGVADQPGGQLREATAEIPYAPTVEWSLAPAGMLVWGRTDRYQLLLSRTGRDTVRVIEAGVAAVPLSDSLRSRAFEAARTGNGVLAYAAPMAAIVRMDDIPTHRPLWSAVQGDGLGRVWVALPSADRRVARLAVFDSTGALLGELPAPHRRILEGTWFGNEVVLIDEDAEGRPVIRIFAIDTTGH